MKRSPGGNPCSVNRLRAASAVAVAAVSVCLLLPACGSRVEQTEQATQAAQPPAASSATAAPPVAASCAGFRNGPGIDDGWITIGNATDTSGPAQDAGGPAHGSFRAAQQAVAAYVAYFNETSNVCGRKLRLLALDSRTDTGGDRVAASTGCEQAFAMVGSMSAADHGGAGAVSACGIPDLRAATVSAQRAAVPTVFAARRTLAADLPPAVPSYFAQRYPDTVRHAAFVYLGSTAAEARSWITRYGQHGFTWVYEQAVDVAEFNYAPYAIKMKQHGVRFVQFLGPYQRAVRLARAMRQQGFQPDVFLLDPNCYDTGFVTAGGADVDGVRVFTDAALFEDAEHNPELRLYLDWLGRTTPGAAPTYHGLLAWSAARLFTETATRLAGSLDRTSLLAALADATEWQGNGLTAPHDAAGAPCVTIAELEGGRWVRETDGFVCGGHVAAGSGG